MKVINDAYYTKRDISIDLIKYIETFVKFDDFDMILEPSAGDGAFSDYFNENFKNKLICYDILPKCDYIHKCDFLNVNLDYLKDKNVLVIGNPPFSLKTLNAFIKKCCLYTSYLCLVLPNSFKNNNRMKMIPKQYHLIGCKDLPNNAFFDCNGLDYHYNTSFFIFKREDYLRDSIDIPILNNGIQFVDCYNDFDYIIYRVGCNSGKIYPKNPMKLYNKYHFFIKLIDKDKTTFYNEYLKLSFDDCLNTTSFKSIPKYQLIKKLNSLSL